MKPIPEDAMPIVERLRQESKRPSGLPRLSMGGILRWKKGKGCARYLLCPLGFIPEIAKCGLTAPSSETAAKYGHLPLLATVRFVWWWDSLGQEDAKAAVDAIWPSGS